MFFVQSISKISQKGRSLAIALLLVVYCLDSADAHLELYHNVEVNLTETAETGVVRIYFTIHAPELLVGFENAGSDIFDAEWLRTRSDDEFQTLFEQGRIFVKEKFSFRINSGPELDLSEQLRFEKPATIRSESYQSGVPVGCLLVDAELKLVLGDESLQVTLAKDAGKRLLLVCTRKGAFPDVKDLDGGDSSEWVFPKWQIPLRVVKDVPNEAGSHWLWLAISILALLISAVIFWRIRESSR